MISLKNKILLMALLITNQNYASSNHFASWLAFFRTKISALKNYFPSFNTPHFDFKKWFFKKPQPALSPKPIEKPLEIVDLTDMKFSKPEETIDNAVTELTNLFNQTTIFPDQKKVLAYYTAILDKKWKELATDFEKLLSLTAIDGYKYLLQKFHYEQKKYLKNPYADPEWLKQQVSNPLKQFAKKDIWLTDMIKPLDDKTKSRFRNEGITDEYLDRIFIVEHTPDPEIPFALLDEHWGNAHIRDFNSKNNIIFIEKEFFDDSISEQIFVLNHEIAHCTQKQVERRPYATYMYDSFAEQYPPALKHFAKIFNEMEADILGILKLALSHLIDILPRFKGYDREALAVFPNNRYPLHRYDIALTVVKSLITGKVPKEIPDSWINGAGQELKREIHRLQNIHHAEKNKPRAKL